MRHGIIKPHRIFNQVNELIRRYLGLKKCGWDAVIWAEHGKFYLAPNLPADYEERLYLSEQEFEKLLSIAEDTLRKVPNKYGFEKKNQTNKAMLAV